MDSGHRRSFRVGLTGGIASGKTTVARLFGALGVPIIDADALSREVTAPGSPLLHRIAERFGAHVIGADGSLDRRALRSIVFADTRARADLEALTHPAIFHAMEERSATAGGPYQILVIPLLIETLRAPRVRHGNPTAPAARPARPALPGDVDRVLVVDCDEELQIRRLQARDGSTQDEARSILAAQVPRAARLAAADDVITNDGDLHSLRIQVEQCHSRYRRLAAQAAT